MFFSLYWVRCCSGDWPGNERTSVATALRAVSPDYKAAQSWTGHRPVAYNVHEIVQGRQIRNFAIIARFCAGVDDCRGNDDAKCGED
jgi:hypothetical protein